MRVGKRVMLLGNLAKTVPQYSVLNSYWVGASRY